MLAVAVIVVKIVVVTVVVVTVDVELVVVVGGIISHFPISISSKAIDTGTGCC